MEAANSNQTPTGEPGVTREALLLQLLDELSAARNLVANQNPRGNSDGSRSGSIVDCTESNVDAPNYEGLDPAEKRRVVDAIHQYQQRTADLDGCLQTLQDASARLGSSMGILSASHIFRQRLRTVLVSFRLNAEALYPDLPSTRHATDVLSSQHVLTYGVPIEELPEQLSLLANDASNFLEQITFFSEFVQDAVKEPIIGCRNDLEYLADCLNGYTMSTDIPLRSYVHQRSLEIGTHLQDITNAVRIFIDVGLPAIRGTQQAHSGNLLKLSTVATLFSGITAQAIQFSLPHSGTALERVTTLFFFTSLVLSISAAVNSLLSHTWTDAPFRPPKHKVPLLIFYWINHSPLFLMALSVSLFSAGLVCFCYYTVEAWISNTVLILTILCNFGLAISFAWFVAERWAYRQHQGTETAMGALIGWALKFQTQSHFINNTDMKQVGRRMVDVLKSIAGALATCLGWCLRFCSRRKRGYATHRYARAEIDWASDFPDHVYGPRPARIPVRPGVGASRTSIIPVTPTPMLSPEYYDSSFLMAHVQERTDPRATSQPFVTGIPETQPGYPRDSSQSLALDQDITFSHRRERLSQVPQAVSFQQLRGTLSPVNGSPRIPTPMLSPNYYASYGRPMAPAPGGTSPRARISSATQADTLHYAVHSPAYASTRPLLSTENSQELGNAHADEEANVYEDSDTGVFTRGTREYTRGAPSIPRQPSPTTTRIDTLAPALKKMAAVQTSQGHSTAINHLQFHPHGNLLATCGRDNKTILWSIPRTEMGEEVKAMKTISHMSRPIKQLAWSPDGTLLLARSTTEIEFWNRSGALHSRFSRSGVESVTWLRNSTGILTAERNRVVEFDVFGQETAFYPFQTMDVNNVVAIPDGQRLLVTASLRSSPNGWVSRSQRVERCIAVYNTNTRVVESRVPILHDAHSVVLSRFGAMVLVSYGNEAPPQLWQVRMRYTQESTSAQITYLRTYRPKGKVNFSGAAFFGGTTEDELVLIPTSHGTTFVWGRDNEVLYHTFDVGDGAGISPFSAAWNSARFMLASTARDGRLCLWTSSDPNPTTFIPTERENMAGSSSGPQLYRAPQGPMDSNGRPASSRPPPRTPEPPPYKAPNWT